MPESYRFSGLIEKAELLIDVLEKRADASLEKSNNALLETGNITNAVLGAIDFDRTLMEMGFVIAGKGLLEKDLKETAEGVSALLIAAAFSYSHPLIAGATATVEACTKRPPLIVLF